MDATLNSRGRWRSLSATARAEIDLKFWEVGRLTLEWLLTPRIADQS
jgi:hypothetical protein